MKMNVYYVKNNLSNLSDGLMLFPTDAYAVARVSESITSHHENLNEYQLHKIAIFDTETSILTVSSDELISFSSRDLVETSPISTSVTEVTKNINSIK